ncbi:acyl-CoA N-acyltransferase [Aspergillus unguis]
MSFSLEPAVANDAPRLTEIYFAAFTNVLSQRITPDTGDVREFQTAAFKKDIENAQNGKGMHFTKAVDKDGVIAGFSSWKVYEGLTEDEGTIQWPASSDAELCTSFFGGMNTERKKIIGDQPHYELSMLAVDPAFGRRGLGGMLLKWGLDRADEKQVPTFISSSPEGRGLYEKNGAQALHTYEVIPGYNQSSMVRPAAGLRRG